MTPFQRERLNAGQPWFSLGMVSLVIGLSFHFVSPHWKVGGVPASALGITACILSIALVVASIVKTLLWAERRSGGGVK
jgi:nitrate reductase gamma subunit